MCDLCGAPPYITANIEGELRGLCAMCMVHMDEAGASSGDDSD